MENRIKQIKKEKGHTQQQLANGLSVTIHYISLLEQEEVQATISVGIEIANRLDTGIYTLFGFDKFECEQCHGGSGGN